MIEPNLEFRISPQPQLMGYAFELRIIDRQNKAFAKPVTMQSVSGEDAGRTFIDPMLVLDKATLQRLMNELWDSGIRPSNGSGDANAFEAVRYHLEDMRKLVFKDKKS